MDIFMARSNAGHQARIGGRSSRRASSLKY